MRVIKGKLKGKTPRLKEREAPHQADVVDLMARLRASLEGTKKGKASGEKSSSTAKKRKADGRKRRVA
jgi:non-homologous end joining protein Ku